jgi:phage major head subunit gpT-like protein
MNITVPALSVLFTQAEVRFGQALEATPSWADQLATTMPSSTAQNIYAWMDRIPVLRKWLGDRVLNSVHTHSRTVVNQPFELTDFILAENIRHDQYGVFNTNLQMFGMQAKKWADQQLAYYLINSAASAAQGCADPVNGYDGKPMFATDHPILGGDVAGGVPSGASSTQSNLFVNTALTYDNYVSVRSSMAALKGADGQPLYNVPDLLVVPPQLEGKAKNIIEADFLAGVNGVDTAPQSNVYKGTAKVLMLQELSSRPHAWYLMCSTNVVKPLIWQLDMAPRFTYLVNPNDINVFMARQFIYGVEAWGAPAESLWFLAAAATSGATYAG